MLHRSPRSHGESRPPGLAGSLGLLLLLVLPRLAHAESLVTFDVPRQGGAYTVKVHPDVITVLHFPAQVEVAYCIQDPAPALVERHPRVVTIHPGRRMQHASVNVVTAAFPVAVLAEVVERPEDAHLMVQFRDRDLERELESRVRLEVERQMLPREAALARARAALEAERARFRDVVDQAALRRMADGIRARHRVVTVDAWARKQHAILRAERTVWVGADAFVVFSIQNRASAALGLRRVTVHAGGQEHAGMVSFPGAKPDAARGLAGTVAPRERATGVIVLRDAARWAGELVSVHALPQHAQGQRAALPLTASFVLRQ